VFESLEDMIEQSVALNMRVLPIMQGVFQIVENVNDPKFVNVRQEILEATYELEQFITKIQASSDEETGEIDLNDFKERQFH
jgi:hypothetical protein